MFEDVIGAVFKEAAKAGKWIIDKNKELDLSGVAAKKYAAQMEDRYNTVRIFGMDKPLPLRDIYVRVNILEKIVSRQRITIEELQIQFERNRRSFGTVLKTKPGIEAANELHRFIVLGRPGSGKTTFLKFLALQSLDGKLHHNRLPIFIGVKDFADSGKTLIAFIVEQFDICHLPNAEPFVVRVLDKGRCQILLDGLDEVNSDKRDDAIKEIYDFSEKYRNNQIILSCRTAAYNHWFDKFTDVEIADFDGEQMRAFVRNWFRDEPEVMELCWRKLNENTRIQELGSNPLLLTLLCLSFNETMDFPQNRAELYREAIHVFLKKWDTTRRIKRDVILYRSLTTMRKESLFARIAAESFENGEYFLPQRKLETRILDFIKHLPRVKREAPEPDGETILKEIEAQHGIFVERASHIYSFAHLTFQEYFTAKYIVDNAHKGTLRQLVDLHLTDNKWREVFLLTTEMLDDATGFLMTIAEKVEKYEVEKSVAKLLEATRQVINKISPYPAPINRALALFRILDHVNQAVPNRTPGHAISFTQVRELALALAVDIAYELIGTNSITNTINLMHTIEEHKAHTLAIGLRDDENLDIELLLDYLKANEILLECLSTECCVQDSARQAIIENLLTVAIFE